MALGADGSMGSCTGNSYSGVVGGGKGSTSICMRISIGLIRIRGYVKFLQKLKAQRCIEVSDTDTYQIRDTGHVEVSGLYRSTT